MNNTELIALVSELMEKVAMKDKALSHYQVRCDKQAEEIKQLKEKIHQGLQDIKQNEFFSLENWFALRDKLEALMNTHPHVPWQQYEENKIRKQMYLIGDYFVAKSNDPVYKEKQRLTANTYNATVEFTFRNKDHNDY